MNCVNCIDIDSGLSEFAFYLSLIDMHHAIKESPAEDVCKKSRKYSTGEETLATDKEPLPASPSLHQQQQPQYQPCHQEEQESIQPCQPQQPCYKKKGKINDIIMKR